MLNAGWSHPTASRSAHVAASSAPPTTNPKNRGPVVATTPGSHAAASCAVTSEAGVGVAGTAAPPSAARSQSRDTSVATGRSAAPVR